VIVRSHEVVVVGSRCAGAATAMLLARMGHDVALLDRSTFPSDTLSTHALSRAGVVQLHRWGLLESVLASGVPPIRSVTFALPDGERTVREVKTTADVDLLVAPRRYLLDALLREAAVMAGTVVYPAATVTEVTRNASGRIDGVRARRPDGEVLTVRADCVVGADGRNSALARLVGAPVRHRSVSPSGTFYTYVQGLDATGFEFHLAPSALVGVFPTHGEQACVWLCAPGPQLRPLLSAGGSRPAALLAMINDCAPDLGARLRRTSASSVRGAVHLPNVVRRPAGPGWALVGDAGYHRDPITGYGISDAFRDAELLATSLNGWLSGTVSEREAGRSYDQARNAAVHEIFSITRELAGFPPLPCFVALQKQLSVAIEREALWLSVQPFPGRQLVLTP
jgi:2-polyprenyl-6-methoxyphenol hydroxylase-like FAD-dependent oxidoreductase